MKTKLTLSLLIIFLSASVSFSQTLFKMPSQNWALQIDLSDFEIQKQEFTPDSLAFQVSAINEKLNINLSIFIERTNSEGDKVACREYYWSKAEKSPLDKQNVLKYERDNVAIVEHDARKHNGKLGNFHSLNAYLVNKGYWMDIHLSKIDYSKNDKKEFDRICKSISIKN